MDKQNQYNPQSVPHPGSTLSEKLEEMGMGPKEFAIRTGKPEKTITLILKGDSSITPEMAILFENVTRIPANFWLNHQKGYDEYIARKNHMIAVDQAKDWAKSFPIAALVNGGWIEKKNTIREKTGELLSFFGFADHKAWEDYYFEQQLKVTFRISLASTSQPYAISAWLRIGELQAEKIKTNEFSMKAFKNSLIKVKALMAEQPDDFFPKLQTICSDAGVKVVYTPCLPKAPINGSTRWLNNTPLIQLTGRYKRNDIFWFTFFHEAGHLILHGKKDIFLEKVDYSDKDLVKEKEADQFASDWLLKEEEENQILESMPLTDK